MEVWRENTFNSMDLRSNFISHGILHPKDRFSLERYYEAQAPLDLKEACLRQA